MQICVQHGLYVQRERQYIAACVQQRCVRCDTVLYMDIYTSKIKKQYK